MKRRILLKNLKV